MLGAYISPGFNIASIPTNWRSVHLDIYPFSANQSDPLQCYALLSKDRGLDSVLENGQLDGTRVHEPTGGMLITVGFHVLLVSVLMLTQEIKTEDNNRDFGHRSETYG